MTANGYEFHPLAEAYPLLVGDAFKDLCADIGANGLDKDIWLYEGKILDGRNRYLACNQAGVEPRFVQYTGDDPEGFVATQNDHRRHESQESIQKRRAARVERVAALRREGSSTREIADTVGISQSQVVADLKHATEQGCSVEPKTGKIKGKDNKTRTARPKKPAGEREPGEDDDAFDQRDAEKDARRKEAGKPKPRSKDATGRTIPDCQKDVFGDPLLPEVISWSKEVQDVAEKQVERLKRKILHYGFAHVKDAYKHLDDLIVAAQCLRESLEAGIPHAVCPKCDGKGCKECRNCGHYPKWRFEELQEQEACA